MIEHKLGQLNLWYSYPNKYAHIVDREYLDGFLVALLHVAMLQKEHIELLGPVSEKLYYNLSNYYLPSVSLISPLLDIVDINPCELYDGHGGNSGNGVITGFSGGFDSFCALHDHYFSDVPQNYRITHLMYNNFHAHDARVNKFYGEKYERLLPFAKEHNLEFIKIDSNLAQFTSVMDYRLVHSPSNVSALLGIKSRFSKYVFASGVHYSDCSFGETQEMMFTDPFTVHLLSTETLECISSGCQYSRAEKIKIVSQLEPSYRYLDVCASTHHITNCSKCWKCLRTLFTLEILQMLDLYKSVFDLDRYWKERTKYLIWNLQNDEPFMRENRKLARDSSHRIGRAIFGLSLIISLLRRLVLRLMRPALKTIVWLLPPRLLNQLRKLMHRLPTTVRRNIRYCLRP